jgi:hypothetical protein
MGRGFGKICHEVAGRVLQMQRGLNTPERRLELADQIEAAIESYLTFEKRKAKPLVRRDK